MTNLLLITGEIDDEVRHFKGETGMTRTRIRVDHESGSSSWFTLKGFGERADSLSELEEGDRVYVEGSLRSRGYEKDGEKKVEKYILVKTFEVLG